MRYIHNIGEAQDQGARQLSTGGLVLISAKDDIVIGQADIEVFDTAAGAGRAAVGSEEFESHGLSFGGRRVLQVSICDRRLGRTPRRAIA